MKAKKVIKYLEQQIEEFKRNAEEYIQDRDNEEAADREFNKIEAFNEVIEYLKNENN